LSNDEALMTTTPVSVIIQKCIENNRMAQHELFHMYKQKVRDLTYKSLGGAFDIDDIVQQVFIAIFGSLKNFKGMSSFDTWIYRITVKTCTTQLRKKYRKRQPNIHSDSMEREHEDTSCENPAALIEQKELHETIYSALDKLSIEKRMIVVMYEMEGYSLEEIADIIKKPIGTVKSRLFHGRKALVKHLRGYNSEEIIEYENR
jgi:RNA polymerase sigma-70 factor, ECF subfamily